MLCKTRALKYLKRHPWGKQSLYLNLLNLSFKIAPIRRLKSLIFTLVLNRELPADKWFLVLQVLCRGEPWPHSFPLALRRCGEGCAVARDEALGARGGVGRLEV